MKKILQFNEEEFLKEFNEMAAKKTPKAMPKKLSPAQLKQIAEYVVADVGESVAEIVDAAVDRALDENNISIDVEDYESMNAILDAIIKEGLI